MVREVAADVENREELGIDLKEAPHGSHVQVPGVSCNIHECVNIAISRTWVIYRDRIGRGTRQVGNTTS